MQLDPTAPQIRCALCGCLFLIGEDHARLTNEQADRFRLRHGDRMCHECWIREVLTDPEGRTRFVTGHA